MRSSPIFLRSAAGTVSSLGEQRLIGRIRRWLGASVPPSPAGMGDDCAVLRPAAGRELVTVDPVIHGVHFDASTSPRQAGAKLMNRNVSDIAAMGGRPRAAVVSLALDPRTSLKWLAEFHRGLAREAKRHGVSIVGGDIAMLPGSFVATLALIGEAAGRVLTRTGSKSGDRIYVTGSLGRSLRTGHHHSFLPRLAEGAWLAKRPEVRSMMDVSDGLAKDLATLTPRGLAPALFKALVPRRAGSSLREALCDGEDYELLFTAAPGLKRASLENAWKRAFPRTPLTCVGRMVRKGEVPPDAVPLGDYRGYEHLR
ncbi:MAG TPA: thiamine-phosphate kinase [Opitutaceae bacterium]|jgi:thiamine-monophosphate kinase|nr:thiamine-phosphate kinase [Opitutaceae bacterium]